MDDEDGESPSPQSTEEARLALADIIAGHLAIADAAMRQHEKRIERELEKLHAQDPDFEIVTAPWNIEDPDLLRRAYLHDGNPLWVWQAIMVTPELEELPIWVRSYLSGVAIRLICYTAELDRWKKNEAPRKVAQALGFLKEGRGTAFSSWMTKYWVWVGSKVEELKLAGEKEYIAIETVAEKYDLSPSTIRRAWEAYQRITK